MKMNNSFLSFKAVYTGGKTDEQKRMTANNICRIRPEGRKEVVKGLNKLNADLSKIAIYDDYTINFFAIPATFFDENERAHVSITDEQGSCIASAKADLRGRWGQELQGSDLVKAINTLFQDINFSVQNYMNSTGKTGQKEQEVKDILDELV